MGIVRHINTACLAVKYTKYHFRCGSNVDIIHMYTFTGAKQKFLLKLLFSIAFSLFRLIYHAWKQQKTTFFVLHVLVLFVWLWNAQKWSVFHSTNQNTRNQWKRATKATSLTSTIFFRTHSEVSLKIHLIKCIELSYLPKNRGKCLH